MSLKPATIIGHPNGTITWNSDFSASRDNQDRWSGSESFTCRLNEVTALVPRKGAPCQHPGWAFLKTSSVSIANLEGDICQVSVTYIGYNEWQVGSDNGGNTNDLGISMSDRSLLLHPNYKAVSAEEMSYIVAWQQNKLEESPSTPFTFAWQPSLVDNDGEPISPDPPPTIASDKGKELFTYLKKGVDTYLYPVQIWSETYTSRVKPGSSLMSGIGKKSTPSGAPTPAGRDWLYVGLSASEGAGGIWQIRREWQLSGEEGLDTTIY